MVLDRVGGGGQSLGLWQVPRGGGLIMTMLTGLGLSSKKKGADVGSGWREVGRDRRCKGNGQQIWGENGGDGGWPLPNNKKKPKKTVQKKRSG